MSGRRYRGRSRASTASSVAGPRGSRGSRRSVACQAGAGSASVGFAPVGGHRLANASALLGVGVAHRRSYARMRRVTVLGTELRGFWPGGGMGTATTFHALALARMGHSVEILLAHPSGEVIDSDWEAEYER